jgi:zinc protease
MGLFEVSAAPHLPAGILSPYRYGERGAAAAGFANHHCDSGKGADVAASLLLPVRQRGEVPGRAMRGGGDADNRSGTIASSAAQPAYIGQESAK